MEDANHPTQDSAAQIAADRIRNPKVSMRDWFEGGWIVRDFVFEDAQHVAREVVREVQVVRLVRVLSPVPAQPTFQIDLLVLLVWIAALAGCLVCAFSFGWFVRDHLAPWLLHGIGYLIHGLQAGFRGV